MNEKNKSKLRWRFLRWGLIGVAVLITLYVGFCTVENWRGKRAWIKCKAELEAKGAMLDWDKLIPPPVPDDENFFAAPKMQDWFVYQPQQRPPYTNKYVIPWISTNILVAITNRQQATDYLAWSGQFQPCFDQIRVALERPFARMDGDYSNSVKIPIPNFIAMRALVQILSQRTKSFLLLDKPENALLELTLLNNSRKLLEVRPTGKPQTMVASMVNVAVGGVFAEAVAEGLRSGKWREEQLAVLQKQFAEKHPVSLVSESFKEEQAHIVRITQSADFNLIATGELFGYPPKGIANKLKSYAYKLMPRGWAFQNLVVALQRQQKGIDQMDPFSQVVFPSKLDQAMAEVAAAAKQRSVFSFLANVGVPNFSKAMQSCAYNQTLANQAQIVCALERFKLALGNYPATLTELTPQFIEKIPHDLIGGEPLHYQRTADGKFLLYSIGWNETDDGGRAAPLQNNGNGATGYAEADWVWKN